MSSEPAQVTVIGGSGAVGQLLVRLWSSTGRQVTVVDTAPQSVPDAARVVEGDVADPSDAVRTAVREADTVVLALPESVATAAVSIVADLMAPGALLVETLSVKSRIAECLAAEAPQVQSVGINPMFAPGLGMSGRPVALVVHRHGSQVEPFRSTLRSWDARVVELTADEHDRRCAATQALTHATVLAFGLALANLEATGADLVPLATPPHNVMLALLARISGGEPEVYRDIQSGNPYAHDARKALTIAMNELCDVVDHGAGYEFAELMARAQRGLGDDIGDYREICLRVIGALP